MRVALQELIEAFERRTKMKRAPDGVRSTGLKEVALVPALGGMRVEMPGGSHFVWSLEGELMEVILLDASAVPRILKVVKSHLPGVREVNFESGETDLSFKCGGTTFSIPRRLPSSKH